MNRSSTLLAASTLTSLWLMQGCYLAFDPDRFVFADDDAGLDAAPPDSGVQDAGYDSGTDSGRPDAGWDAGESDAGVPPPVRSLTVGADHVCATTMTGAECWGGNDFGQVGDDVGGVGSDRPDPTPTVGLPVATLISGGTVSSCAISSGLAYCWGSQGAGALGDGTTGTGYRARAALVPGLSNLTDLSVGSGHACAVLSGGGVRCWGSNAHGQAGNGRTSSAEPVPVAAQGITGAVNVACGVSTTCISLSDGSARCWGRGTDGQLGDGRSMSSSVPQNVATLTNVSDICVSNHACAVNDGRVWCWGANGSGQVGNGLSGADVTRPVDTGLDAVEVACGQGHTCARTATGEVYCWGWDFYGQLGGSTTPLVPTRVAGLPPVDRLDVGGATSCALAQDRTVYCWGDNAHLQLGRSTPATSTTPFEVAGSGDP